MTKELKEFFKSRGFARTGPRTRHKEQDWQWWYVNETGSTDQKGETRLHLAIGIKDPFKEDSGFGLLALRGDITPDGVFVHYDETPYCITETEQPRVLQVVERAADIWFEHWHKAEVLIEHFRNPAGILSLRAGPKNRFLTFERTEAVRPRITPIHDYWLSLIYFHLGKFSESMSYAQKRLKEFESATNHGTEPGRTLRQIAELEIRMRGNN